MFGMADVEINKVTIDGVKVIPLLQIPDERGKIMRMLRCTDAHFEKFGEIYFSVSYPAVIKAWHVHKRMSLNYAVVKGRIKLVLYDLRPGSKTKGNLMELFLGEDNYCLVHVPPGVANGFKNYGSEPAIVANCTDIPHDKEGMTRMDPIKNDVIKYDWSLKHC